MYYAILKFVKKAQHSDFFVGMMFFVGGCSLGTFSMSLPTWGMIPFMAISIVLIAIGLEMMAIPEEENRHDPIQHNN